MRRAGVRAIYVLENVGVASSAREVPHESPRDPRVTVLGAYAPSQRPRRLTFQCLGKRVRSPDVLRAIRALPHSRAKPTVVVLDNAPSHANRAVKEQRPALARSGLRLVPRPPYSPDMNPIEPVFGSIKRHEMPERTSFPKEPPRAAVVRAFRTEAVKPARPRREKRRRTSTSVVTP